MLGTLKSIDQSLFFFLNGLHSPVMDIIMFYGTQRLTWLPLYLLLLYLLIRRYRWQTIWILLAVALMILVSDQLSNVVKESVARFRPTHEPGLSGIHTVNGYLGGDLGFYSAHASNNLALAVFLILVLGRPFRGFAAIMLAWSFFMAYTRIYLGVHYPGDILAGWIAGCLIGWCFGWLCIWFIRKPVNNQSGS